MFAFTFADSIRKTFAGLTCCAALVAGTAASAQTTLVDSGQGNASGGYSLFNSRPNFNHLACKFTLGSAFTIGTVQPWMVKPSGNIVVKLCANNGSNLPGTVLASQSFPTTFAGFNAAWVTFGGLNWSQPAGTYWICFEPTTGTTNGSMPGNAPNVPNALAATAFFTNGNPGYVLNGAGDVNGRFGLRLYTPAPPTPIHVPADHATIQAAINAAALPNQEIIVAPGTYNGAINYNGKTLKIKKAIGRSRGPSEAIIDATGTNLPAVTIGPGSASGTELDGFTVRGGSALTGLGFGGGVIVNGATATIKNCVITQNGADSGGGVAAVFSANATVQDCTIFDNDANTLGGGAYINGSTLTLTNSTIEFNNAVNSGGGIDVNCGGIAVVNGCIFTGNTTPNYGGGARVGCSTSTASFTNCEFTNNTAFGGGGVIVSAGAASFTGCDFVSNIAFGTGLPSGGAIQATGSGGSLTVSTCWFFDNQAENGGGIQLLNYAGTVNISGSMFDENFANSFAGGVHVRASIATVTNSIFTANQADFGGGISINSGGALNLGGSSFCGNTPNAIDGTYTNNGGNTLTCPEPGDTNGDNVVNVSDLLAVISAWGSCPTPPMACPADVSGDGQINVTDLLMVISNWG